MYDGRVGVVTGVLLLVHVPVTCFARQQAKDARRVARRLGVLERRLSLRQRAHGPSNVRRTLQII